MPVLILTARDAVADGSGGSISGPDDYLLKPFAPAEFEARVRAPDPPRPGTSPTPS